MQRRAEWAAVVLTVGAVVAADSGEYHFLRVEYTCDGYEDALRVKISPQQGSFAPWFNEIQAVIYGVKRQPSSVTLNGKVLKQASFDAGAQTLTLLFPYVPAGGELRLRCGDPGQKAEVCFAMAQAAK